MKKKIATLLLTTVMSMGLAAPALADVWDTNAAAWGENVHVYNSNYGQYITIDGVVSTGHVNAEADSGNEFTEAWLVCYCSEPARVTIAKSVVEPFELGAGIAKLSVGADGKITLDSSLTPTWTNAVPDEDYGELRGQGTYWDLSEGVYRMSSANASNMLYLVVGSPDNIPEAAQTAAAPAFKDVKAGEYYCEPVAWAVDAGITTGTTATTFSPNETCTQAQILTFLWRAAGEPQATVSNPYTNAAVADGQYFYTPLLWAWEKGMVSDAAFNPNADCRRSDVVTYLWKLADKPLAAAANFTDVADGADYAEAVAWAVEKGVTTGTTATTFGPTETCTRGQIVTFLWRYFVD